MRRRCVRGPTGRTISVMVVPSLLLLLLLLFVASRPSKRVEMSRLRGRESDGVSTRRRSWQYRQDQATHLAFLRASLRTVPA